MLNLDPAKLVVILVLALIVMGPERLPSVARQLGTVWKTLSGYKEQAEDEIRKAIPDLDLPRIPRSPRAAATNFLGDLISPKQANSLTTTPSAVDDDDAGPQNRTSRTGAESTVAEASDREPLPQGLGVQDPSMN